MPRAPLLAALLIVPTCMAGCWTTADQGKAMRADIDELKDNLTTDVKRSKQERKKLQKIMEKATVLLTRNSADVGAQVDRIQSKLDKLTGMMEQYQKKVGDLSKEFTAFKAKVDVKLEGVTPGQGPKGSVPDDPNKLFKLASDKYRAGAHKEARILLKRFLDKYPADSRIPMSHLMRGNSYYIEQKFAPAIVTFDKILKKHARSKVYPEALFKTGMAFYQLKYCSDAKTFLSLLLKKHRRHGQAKRARKVLKLIRKNLRNKSFCSS